MPAGASHLLDPKMTFAFHFRRPSAKALSYLLGISRTSVHRFNPSGWDLNAVRIICSQKYAARMITTKKDEVHITKTEGAAKGEGPGSGKNDGCCGGAGEGGNNNKERLDQEEILSIQVRVQELHRHANYAEALELSEVLIQRCETAFGLNHPATASSYNNAAVMHKLLGNYNQARSRYNDALKVYQKVLGHDHSSTASTLNNIGNLDRAQVHYDDNLSREEQSQLLQSSIDYIQQALTIRQNELGNDHPHTVTSRSNLGSSLAAQFLFVHQLEKNNPISPKNSAVITTKISKKYNEEQREMAEHHLRSALQLALQNQSQVVKNNNYHAKNVHNKDEKELDVKITSLSAAAAAQNLAVFLKVSADMSSTSQSMELYMEAKWLYEQALQARKEKLGSQHPELIATMSSLAELKATIGDEEGANAIRREIIQTLDPKLLDSSQNHK